MVGGGGVAQIGNLGVINFAASGASGAGSTGAQLSLGAQHIGRVFSIGAASIVATRNYRDVAAMNGDGVRRKQLSAFASLSSRRFGAAGVAYGGVDQDNARPPVLVASWQAFGASQVLATPLRLSRPICTPLTLG